MQDSKSDRSRMKVCVVGLGMVGLPTAITMAYHGIAVHGFDISRDLVQKLNSGKYEFGEPTLGKMFEEAKRAGRITIDSKPAKSDYFVVCVPTYIKEQVPVMTEVLKAVDIISPYLEDGNTVIIESTCVPGTTRKMADSLKTKRRDLKRIHVCHIPERLIPGNAVEELVHDDRVVGGVDAESAQKGAELYHLFLKGRILLTDDLTAELVKVFENTYRDVNIALANTFARICEELGANVWEAIRLANTHPRVDIHKPGVGVGGTCVPVVPLFLRHLVGEDSLILHARKVNDRTPEVVADKIHSILVDIDRPKVALLGMTYKKDVGDTRGSPAVQVYKRLKELLKDSSRISCYDPFIHDSWTCGSLQEAITGTDLIAILTNHTVFSSLDPADIVRKVNRAVVYDAQDCIDREQWEKAGFEVVRLGDGRNWTKLKK